MRRRAVFWVCLLAAVFLLSGCTTWTSLQQPDQQNSIRLEPGSSLGQTFTAHADGLQGIAVYLSPVETGQADIQLVLAKNPPGNTRTITSTIPLSEVQQAGWYHFDFPAIDGSSDQDYFAEFSLTGSGELSLATGLPDSYLDGALYDSGQPVEAQAAFKLLYDPSLAASGIGSEGAIWLLYLLAAVWLFVIPGWGVLSVLYRGWTGHAWIEKIGLAAGFSLALYPLLYLWTDLAGLKLGVLYAWLPALVGAALIVFQQLRLYRSGGFTARISYRRENLLPDIMLVVVLGFLIFSRLWVIRELDYPLWGDSYQHSMIAQLLVDNKGLFNSWLPYAELSTFTYHFGFHTFVAGFHWLTGLPLPNATLWTGQIINLLAIITLVPLANRFGRSRWAGVVAILVAGLLSSMPQYYMNWGRYTQLSGQAILPVAVALSFAYLEERSTDRRLMAVLALALGGLALTHYRIIIYSSLFFIAYFLLKARKDGVGSLALKITWIGLGAIALCLPWLIHLSSGGIPAIAAAQLSTPVNQLSAFATQYNSIGNAGAYLSPILWFLMLLAAGWGLWRREIDCAVFSTWWLLIFLAANPQWLNLPGSGVISNFAVLIAAYIPAGVLIGAAAGWLAGLKAQSLQAQKKYNAGIQIALIILVLLCSFYGIQSRLKDDNLQGALLYTRADQRAAHWINANLPEQARFLVNAVFAFGDWVIVGSDGGWWLPLTAHRQTSLPPINYGNEKSFEADYREQVNLLQSEILAKGIDHPDVLRMLHERGIRYIYVGQRHGRVNNAGADLYPPTMLASPAFKPIYHQDRVYIFEIVQ